MNEVFVVINAASGKPEAAFTVEVDASIMVAHLRERDKHAGAAWYYQRVPVDQNHPIAFEVTFQWHTNNWVVEPLMDNPGTSLPETGASPTERGPEGWKWGVVHGFTRMEALRKCKSYLAIIIAGRRD
jgi:hypothetical protein